MKTEIKLIRRGWVNVSQGDFSVWVRGQAHLGDAYYDTKSLAELFVGKSKEVVVLDELASRLNGCWAVIVRSREWLYIAVDHSRSYQVLYSCTSDQVVVSDDIRSFGDWVLMRLEEESVHEYLSSCVVWRNRTIFKDVFSLQVGERVLLQKDTIESKCLFAICPALESPPETECLFQQIDNAFVKAIKRLVESVGDRRIVVPLSGGYDSRLVVSYLYRVGFRNVLCYSYGKKGNEDSLISKCVAERLGYEWKFVEYGQNELIFDNTLLEYLAFAANGSGTPFIQEYEAVRQLKKNRVLKETDIIVPGHCFDVYAGSQLHDGCYSWNVASQIVGGTCCLFMPANDYRRCLNDVKEYVRQYGETNRQSAFEIFSLKENISKAIYNSLRNYEWFGYEWRMPLTDRDIFELWMSIGWPLRKDRKYFKTISKRLYAPILNDIPFAGNKLDHHVFYDFIRERIWRKIPYCWQRLIYVCRNQKRHDFYYWKSQGANLLVNEVAKLINITSITKRIDDNMNAESAGLRPLLVILSLKKILDKGNRQNCGVSYPVSFESLASD